MDNVTKKILDDYWEPKRKDLEQAIASDYRSLYYTCRRMEARISQYKPFSESPQATCDAMDAVWEMQRQIRELEDALRRM